MPAEIKTNEFFVLEKLLLKTNTLANLKLRTIYADVDPKHNTKMKINLIKLVEFIFLLIEHNIKLYLDSKNMFLMNHLLEQSME